MQTLSQTSLPYTLRVTFSVTSRALKRTFVNIELHRDMDDARLRASALGWTITKVESL